MGCGHSSTSVDGGTGSSTRLGYAANPAIYRVNAAIEANAPSVEGIVPTQFTVTPNLPAGLTLDSNTGVLTGTPTALTPTSDYSVTASNSTASIQTTLLLKIASTVPYVTNGQVDAVVESGNAVYLGGRFTQIGPPTGSGVMLDVHTGTKPGFAAWPAVNNDVFEVAADPASPGGFYIGGFFTQVGTLQRNSIAKILPDGRPDPTWNANVNTYGSVLTIAVSGSVVYVGGRFSSIGGQLRHNIAALDASTGNATDWNPGVGASGFDEVRAIAVRGSTVYVGGEFDSLGGQPRKRIGAVDASTGTVTNWNPNADGAQVTALEVSGSTVRRRTIQFHGGTAAQLYRGPGCLNGQGHRLEPQRK